jgi:hypothetical protein
MRYQLSNAIRKLRRAMAALRPHPSIRRYIEFNRRKWPARRKSDSVVLVGLFHWNPSVHYYSVMTNHLAQKHDARIEWFYFFKGRNRLYEKIYSSFGAHEGLCLDSLKIDEAETQRQADEIFASLESKEQLADLTFDGAQIGDLIYDSYLRAVPAATVDLKDTKLRDIIREAMRIFAACRTYFAENRVRVVIADHIVYIYCGIIVRLALAQGIPVYQIFYAPDLFFARIEADPKVSGIAIRWPHWKYRGLFAELSPEEQQLGRERGRAGLEARFAGVLDGSLPHQTAYHSGDAEPILENTGHPRVLVLLHDFCDAVHPYRRTLFADFYDWIHFLLSHAAKTGFDWYVKPHPYSTQEDPLSQINKKTFAELRGRYPTVRFLPPKASNKQIIREGVASMFTVHGTAGHEFAYLGVPVVNAGDNPHADYSFNITARNREEYATLIAQADSLQVAIDKREIEEFFYMHYLYFPERNRAEVNPIPARFFESEDFRQPIQRPENLDFFMDPFTPEQEGKVADFMAKL